MEIQLVFLCMVLKLIALLYIGFSRFLHSGFFFNVIPKKNCLQLHIATASLCRRGDALPAANNLTAWKKASLRLNCSEYSEHYTEEVIKGKRLYHCLTSIFLNETIEFCGQNAAMEIGLFSQIYIVFSFKMKRRYCPM